MRLEARSEDSCFPVFFKGSSSTQRGAFCQVSEVSCENEEGPRRFALGWGRTRTHSASESPTPEIDLSSTSRLSSTLRSLHGAAWRIVSSARSLYVSHDLALRASLTKTVDRRTSVWESLCRSVRPSKREAVGRRANY